jgi:Fur family ferric uptake transcriptional regulator
LLLGFKLKDENTKRWHMTRQREVILKVLKGLTSHPTADELFQLVRRELPHISLGTVYRNLDVLCEQGLVARLELGGAQRRYDAGMAPHHHARCVRCNRLTDVPLDAISVLNFNVDEVMGFRLQDYRLELLGVCADCRRDEQAQAVRQ